VRDIVEAAPSFRSEYLEHLRDNNGLLPHVLIGSYFNPWLVARLRAIRAGAENEDREIGATLALLEAALDSTDDDMSNLVAVSFLECLENFTADKPEWHRLRDALPRRLREELDTKYRA
jgi:hypothetical protein